MHGIVQLDAMSKKESILEAIQRLPSDADYRDAIEEIRVMERIDAGEQAADEGRTLPHEDVKALIRSWISG